MSGPAMATQDEVVAWAVARGVQPYGTDGLRFVAHEVYHALDLDLPDAPGAWDTDAIHAAVLDLPSDQERIRTEVEARAAERLVCQAMGVHYQLDGWLPVSSFEAQRIGVWMPDELAGLVLAACSSARVRRHVRTILAAGRRKGRKR